MLKLAGIACAATLSAVAAAQGVVMLAPQPVAQASAAEPVASTTQPAPGYSQAALVSKAADGHYWAEATVNGSHVRFLVDTGATAVALSPTDATRLGFHPADLEYGYTVQTASGEARAARVSLDVVSVAGARVSDVEAFVIEEGLETSLLGMTYLGRLSRFEATQSALILRP